MAGNESNNPPEILLGLTLEQAEFIVKNAEANISFALNYMIENRDDASEKALSTLVDQMEMFKVIKKLTETAIKEK